MMLNALKFITFYIYFVGYVFVVVVVEGKIRNGDLLMAISLGGNHGYLIVDFRRLFWFDSKTFNFQYYYYFIIFLALQIANYSLFKFYRLNSMWCIFKYKKNTNITKTSFVWYQYYYTLLRFIFIKIFWIFKFISKPCE